MFCYIPSTSKTFEQSLLNFPINRSFLTTIVYQLVKMEELGFNVISTIHEQRRFFFKLQSFLLYQFSLGPENAC